MEKIKKFGKFTNEEWFWNKKSEPNSEVKTDTQDEEETGIEQHPFAGGGKLIKIDQENWKDWAKIIPKYKDFDQVTFVVDENSDLTIYNPSIVFLAKDPKNPNFATEGEENVSIRYDKKDNPHLKDSILSLMEKNNIIIRRRFMSLVKPEFIGMHCANINSVVVK